MTEVQRIVVGYGEKGAQFQRASLFATLFAVALEIISTCPFANETAEAREILLTRLKFWWYFGLLSSSYCVCRLAFQYIFSPLGVVDILATFPFYLACGLLGQTVAARMDVITMVLSADYDHFASGLAQTNMHPPCPQVDDAFRACSKGLYSVVLCW